MMPKPFSLVCKCLFITVASHCAGSALAHATLVRGALVSDPAAPQPGTPIILELGLLDPKDLPIEDAIVFAEITRQGQEGRIVAARFTETNDAGIYLSEPVTLPAAGRYRLLIRDQTFPQEEARASLNYEVGGPSPKESYIFVLPPTATGPANLRAWLLWLVLLPVGAAVLVTVLVLLTPAQKKPVGQG